jgi:cytochrome c-type biogenesis protein CcmE
MIEKGGNMEIAIAICAVIAAASFAVFFAVRGKRKSFYMDEYLYEDEQAHRRAGLPTENLDK